MNNTYKLNAFTKEGLQELKHHDKSCKYISKNVKLTNKRKQVAQNAVETLHNKYSKKIDNHEYSSKQYRLFNLFCNSGNTIFIHCGTIYNKQQKYK